MSRPAAIVTGARRGIGLGIAEALAAAGFDLMVTDLGRDEDIEPVLEKLRDRGAAAAVFAADIANLSGHGALVEATLGAFGRIDVLVNNAGIASPRRGDLLELAPEDFDRVLAVNLRGSLFLAQTVARWMTANPDPEARRSIINVTSVNADLASPERADYCISKAGLSMATRNLAIRLAPEGIAVFELRPGIIRTDMTSTVSQKYDRMIAEGRVPAGRWGEAGDVGAVAAALAVGSLGFATGSVINVDGALSIPRL